MISSSVRGILPASSTARPHRSSLFRGGRSPSISKLARLSASSIKLAARATRWAPVRPTVSRALAASPSSTSAVRVLVRRMTGQNRPVPRRLSRTRCRFERRGLPVKYAFDSSRSIALKLVASSTSIVRPVNSSQRYHARRAALPVGAARTMASISVCGAASKARFRINRSMSSCRSAKVT